METAQERNWTKLYKDMVAKRGLNAIGSQENFMQKMQNESNRKKVYDDMSQSVQNFGSYDNFCKALGLGMPVETTSSTDVKDPLQMATQIAQQNGVGGQLAAPAVDPATPAVAATGQEKQPDEFDNVFNAQMQAEQQPAAEQQRVPRSIKKPQQSMFGESFMGTSENQEEFIANAQKDIEQRLAKQEEPQNYNDFEKLYSDRTSIYNEAEQVSDDDVLYSKGYENYHKYGKKIDPATVQLNGTGITFEQEHQLRLAFDKIAQDADEMREANETTYKTLANEMLGEDGAKKFAYYYQNDQLDVLQQQVEEKISMLPDYAKGMTGMYLRMYNPDMLHPSTETGKFAVMATNVLLNAAFDMEERKNMAISAKMLDKQLEKIGEKRLQLMEEQTEEAVGKEYGKAAEWGLYAFDTFAGIKRGTADILTDMSTYDFGFSDLNKAQTLMNVCEKADRGEDLTDSEQMLLGTAALDMAVEMDVKLGHAYTAGEITGTSLPLMVQMAINPAAGAFKGLSKSVAKGVLKALAKEGKNTVLHKMLAYSAQGVTQFSLDFVKGAAIAGTTGLAGVEANALEREMGDVKFKLEDGRVVYDGRENQESAWPAFYKAFMSSTIENQSEMFGEYFAPLWKGAKGTLMKHNKEWFKNGYRMLQTMDPRWLNTLKKKVFLNGWAGETAEEIVGGIENALLVGDEKLFSYVDKNGHEQDGVLSWNNVGRTGLDMLPMQVMMGSFGLGVNQTRKIRNYSRSLSAEMKAKAKLEAALSDDFSGDIRRIVENNLETGEMQDKLEEYCEKAGLKYEQKMAVLNYATARMARKGFEMAEKIDGHNNLTSLVYGRAYREGMAIDNSQDLNMAAEYGQKLRDRLMSNDKTAPVVSMVENDPVGAVEWAHKNQRSASGIDYLSDEDVLAIEQYATACMTMEGAMATFRSEYDARRATNKAMVDNMTHTDGMLHPVMLFGNNADGTAGKQVYVVRGNIVGDENGYPDMNKSSKNLVVFDQETGEKRIVSISQIDRIGQAQDAKKELEATNAKVQQEQQASWRALRDGKLSLTEGEKVMTRDAEGEYVQAHVSQSEFSQQTGKILVLLDLGNGETTGIYADHLQQINDEWRNEQVIARENENRTQPLPSVPSEDAAGTEETIEPGDAELPIIETAGTEDQAPAVEQEEEPAQEMKLQWQDKNGEIHTGTFVRYDKMSRPEIKDDATGEIVKLEDQAEIDSLIEMEQVPAEEATPVTSVAPADAAADVESDYQPRYAMDAEGNPTIDNDATTVAEDIFNDPRATRQQNADYVADMEQQAQDALDAEKKWTAPTGVGRNQQLQDIKDHANRLEAAGKAVEFWKNVKKQFVDLVKKEKEEQKHQENLKAAEEARLKEEARQKQLAEEEAKRQAEEALKLQKQKELEERMKEMIPIDTVVKPEEFFKRLMRMHDGNMDAVLETIKKNVAMYKQAFTGKAEEFMSSKEGRYWQSVIQVYNTRKAAAEKAANKKGADATLQVDRVAAKREKMDIWKRLEKVQQVMGEAGEQASAMMTVLMNYCMKNGLGISASEIKKEVFGSKTNFIAEGLSGQIAKNGRSISEVAEAIAEMTGHRFDDTEIRDAIIEVLGNVGSKKQAVALLENAMDQMLQAEAPEDRAKMYEKLYGEKYSDADLDGAKKPAGPIDYSQVTGLPEELMPTEDVPFSVAQDAAGERQANQSVSIALARQIAKMFGLKVEWDAKMKMKENAYVKGDTIYLNPNKKLRLGFIFGHELLHAMKKSSPEKYELFKLSAKIMIGMKLYKQRCMEEAAAHAAAGHRLQNLAAAEEEVVANFAGDLMENGQLLEMFKKQMQDLNKKDQSRDWLGMLKMFAEKVYEFWESVKSILNPESEAMSELDFALDMLQDLMSDAQRKNVEANNQRIMDMLDEQDENGIDLEGAESQAQYSVVKDQETIDKFKAAKKLKAYRAMQLIDGKLYPPMAAVVDGKLNGTGLEVDENGDVNGYVVEQADERPDLAVPVMDKKTGEQKRDKKTGALKWKFKLNKGNKKSLFAAYDPYIHSSVSPLNDQFSEAQSRPNLVTVEVEIMDDELTEENSYHAEKALLSTGKHKWKAGPITGQLKGTRDVYLTRYDRPMRIVPNSEVASVIKQIFEEKSDEPIIMPSNVVTPDLRSEMEKAGVKFVETNNKTKLVGGLHDGKKYTEVYKVKKDKKKDKKDAKYSVEKQRLDKQTKFLIEYMGMNEKSWKEHIDYNLNRGDDGILHLKEFAEDIRRYVDKFVNHAYSATFMDNVSKLRYLSDKADEIDKIVEEKGKHIRTRNVGMQFGKLNFDDVEKLYYDLAGDLSEQDKYLANRVFETAKKLGVEYSCPRKETSLGSEVLGYVRLRRAYFNNDNITDQEKAATILHETIHGVTTYVIYAVDRAENDTEKIKAVHDAVNAAGLVNDEMKMIVANLKAIYHKVQIADRAGIIKKGQYGATSMYEMLAEMSDAEWQKSMKIVGVWARMKDLLFQAVREVLNCFGIAKPEGADVEKSNAYDEIIANLEAMLDNANKDIFDRYHEAVSDYVYEEEKKKIPGIKDVLKAKGDAEDIDEAVWEQGDARWSVERSEQLKNMSEEYFGLYYEGELKHSSTKIAPLTRKGMKREDLEAANKQIDEMSDIMRPYLEAVHEGKRFLPEEVYGLSTIFDNSSYGATVENTLVCTRTLAYNDFCDELKRRLGRPLTVRESFLASQMLYDIANDPQCLYCYVSLDRKAYDEYLLRYMDDRQTVLDWYKNGGYSEENQPSKQELKKEYERFLAGRKDTPNMKVRFDSYLMVAELGNAIEKKDLVTEEVRSQIKKDSPVPEAWTAAQTKYNKLKDKNERAKYKASEEYQNALAQYLASRGGQVKDAEAYAQSASWAKKPAEYRSYTGELLKSSKKMLGGLMAQYGLRFYSFSEYSPAFIVENMQQVRDAALRGLKGFAYTKEVDFARIFAPSGMNINISVYARPDSERKPAMDISQGAHWGQAKALREKYPNVGIVFVATDDAMVEWALEQDWIDVIIPFHIVRTGQDVADFYKWTNYTDMSADKDDKGHKADVYPDEHKNKKETFLELIKKRGLTPRFEKWKDHPNYMRLVNETRRSTDETPLLKPVFDMDAAKDSWEAFVEKGGYYSGYFKDYVDFDASVEQVKQDIEAGREANQVSYGRQDIPVDFETRIANKRRSRQHQNKPLAPGAKYSVEQTKSAEFKRWFGDSKVVNNDGSPRVMYHGSNVRPNDIVKFEMNEGARGNGAYFTSAFPEACDYVREKFGDPEMTEDECEPFVGEYYLSVSDENNIVHSGYGNGEIQVKVTDPDQVRRVSDSQYSVDQTKSAEFKRWFGDWEKDPEHASKVVDAEGKPMVMYHYTSAGDFYVFEHGKSESVNSIADIGFWFSPIETFGDNFSKGDWRGNEDDKRTMKVYLDIKNPKIYDSISEIPNDVMSRYQDLLKEKNDIEYDYVRAPFTVQDDKQYFLALIHNEGGRIAYFKENVWKPERIEKDAERYKELMKEFEPARAEYLKYKYSDAYERFRTDIYNQVGEDAEKANAAGIGMYIDNLEIAKQKYVKRLKEQGYDGIIIRNTIYDRQSAGGENDQYVAFESNQIKSATENNGEFDPENPDIRYSVEKSGLSWRQMSAEERNKIIDDVEKYNRAAAFVDGNTSYEESKKRFDELKEKDIKLFTDIMNSEDTPEQDKPKIFKMIGMRKRAEYMSEQAWNEKLAESKQTLQDLDGVVEYHKDLIKQYAQEETERIRLELEEYDRQKQLEKPERYQFEFSDEQKAENERYKKLAKKHFGLTSSFKEAGYLLDDGTMLNFSGAHAAPAKDAHYYAGNRLYDHRNIAELNDDGQLDTDMNDFIAHGNIRIGDGMINLASKPTMKQVKVLKDLIRFSQHDMWVEFNKVNGDSEHYVDYGDSRPEKIIADIMRYYDEGIKPQSTVKYSVADTTGKKFKRWFGDWEKDPNNASKVVDAEGKPMVVHHGSRNYGFTVFKTDAEWNGDNVGTHFGSANVASEFADEENTYNVYLNIRKPWLTFDFFADNFDNAYLDALLELCNSIWRNDNALGEQARAIMKEQVLKAYPAINEQQYDHAVLYGFLDEFDEDDGLFKDPKMFGSLKTNKAREKMVALMKELLKLGGYDGIKYQNWYEGEGDETCWVALEPNQIKSADVTGEMANNGEYDPENPDIRYSVDIDKSVTKTDAFKSWFGDWEKDPEHASQMVNKFGEPVVFYHGTILRDYYADLNTGDYEKYDDQPFFVFDTNSSKELGAHFGTRKAAEARAWNLSRSSMYQNTETHPYYYAVYLDVKNPIYLYDNGKWDFEHIGKQLLEEGYINQDEYKDLEYNENPEKSVKQLLMNKGYDGVLYHNNYEGGTSAIVFSPTQIKSATQNNGDFDPKNPDIRYSVEKDKSLIGVHNISEVDLLKAMGLGGLANPSMAVVDMNTTTHNEFGEISLIAPSKLIDARTGRNAGTWNDDVWTPTYPKVHTVFDKAAEKNLKNYLKENAEDDYNWLMYQIQYDLEHGKETGYLRFLYLKEVKGIDATMRDWPGFDDRFIDIILKYKSADKFAEAMKDEAVSKKYDYIITDYLRNKRDELRPDLKKPTDRKESREERLERYGKIKDWENQFKLDGKYDEFLKDLWNKQKKAYKQPAKFSASKTHYRAEQLFDSNDNEDYYRWLDAKMESLGAKQKLRTGTTRAGKPIYVDNTLDNASDLMNKQKLTGNSMFGGWGTFIAKLAKHMNSLDEIRARKNELGDETERKQAVDMFDDMAILVHNYNHADLWDGSATRILADIVLHAKQGIKEYAKKKWNVDYTDEELEQMETFVKLLHKKNVKYFETKFDRPVLLEEFVGAIVPKGATKLVKEKLAAAGLDVREYKTGDDEDRAKKVKTLVNKRDDVKFSVEKPGVAQAPVFYSNAMRATENVKQEKATPEQWLKMLQNGGGLKAGEDKWIGLSEWLQEQQAAGVKTLDKQDVLKYIEQHQIEVVDVMYVPDYDNEYEEIDFDKLKQDIYSSDGYLGLVDQFMYDDEESNQLLLDRKAFKEARLNNDLLFDGFDEDYWGEEIQVTNVMAAAKYLGLWKEQEVKDIEWTRLNYVTDYLQNYKEIALVVPSISPYKENDITHFGDAGEGRAIGWIRFGEAVDIHGGRVMVIDEIQSKRHQDGREKGYNTAESTKSYENKMKELLDKKRIINDKIKTYKKEHHEDNHDLLNELRSINIDIEALRNSQYKEKVPDAPFDKNWMELCFKRALRYAAENGFARVAWTTGEQQTERYDLGGVVGEIVAELAHDKDGNELDDAYLVYILDKEDKEYDVATYHSNEPMSEKEIIDLVGKEMAEKIVDGCTKKGYVRLSGDGLKIGGEGMKAFYDKMLPGFVQKYVKKWGASVGKVTMPYLREADQVMWGVDVTPDMKNDVLNGQALFSVEKQEPVRYRKMWSDAGHVFYSNAMRAVDAIKQEKATPEQWLKMLQNGGGLKAGEDRWLGLSEWLQMQKESGVKSISKDQVLDYIEKNQIELVDARYAQVPDTKQLEEYQRDFNSMLRRYNQDPEVAIKKMAEKHGAEFDEAFTWWEDDYGDFVLKVDDSEKAAQFGVFEKKINDTRLRYTTRGLKNKKEIALVMPGIEPYKKDDDVHFGDAGEGRAIAWIRFGDTVEKTAQLDALLEDTDRSYDEFDEYVLELTKKYNRPDLYDENPGILRELLNDEDKAKFDELYNAWDENRKRLDASDPEPRVLVIDEIQSKRHQDGREQGYRDHLTNIMQLLDDNANKARFAAIMHSRKLESKYQNGGTDQWTEEEVAEGRRLMRAWEAAAKELEDFRKENPGVNLKAVPDAPFEKNWMELCFKRMLQYAAENGYDKVAWTTGMQQAERYNLAKHVNKVELLYDDKNGDREYDLVAKNGGIFRVETKNGIVVYFADYPNVEGKPLSDVVGKEIAEKMEQLDVDDENEGELKFSEFNIGGEGMKAFYDKMLPSFVQKYVKKWGASVGEVKLDLPNEANQNMWAIDVTPEMRKSVLEGQPLFRVVTGQNYEHSDEQEAEIRAKIAELEERFGVKLHVRTTVDEVENPSAKKAIEQEEQKRQAGKRWGAAKAWFNPETGSVEIYLPYAEDLADVVKSVLHEVVGHKGLRQLMGLNEAGWNSLMLDMLDAMPEGVKAEILDRASKNGWNTPEAVDEYLAEKAEDEYTPKWWQKVTALVRGLLRKLGVNLLLTDADVKYMLWRSRKTLENKGHDSVMDMAANEMMRWKNGIGHYMDVDKMTGEGIRFRFVGEKAAENAGYDSIQMAKEMAAEGMTASQIKYATGCEIGADGMWRYELADDYSKLPDMNPFNPYMENGEKNSVVTLTSVIGVDNPLFREYPGMKNTVIKFANNSENTGYSSGSDDVNNIVLINEPGVHYAMKRDGIEDNEKNYQLYLQQLLAHEVQHLIQRQEGFASGGSVAITYDVVKEKIMKSRPIVREVMRFANESVLRAIATNGVKKQNLMDDLDYAIEREAGTEKAFDLQMMKRDLQKLSEAEIADVFAEAVENLDLLSMTPAEIYQNLMGEVEARNVMKRYGYTQAQMAKELGLQSEDTKRYKQIYLSMEDADRYFEQKQNNTKRYGDEDVDVEAEERRALEAEVNHLRMKLGQYRSMVERNNKVQDAKEQVLFALNHEITSGVGKVLNSMEIRSLINMVERAKTPKKLKRVIDVCESILMKAELRYEQELLDKLLKTRLRANDNKGVATGKVVDNLTRERVDAIKNAFKKLLLTNIDDELRQLRRKKLELNRKINDGTTSTMDRVAYEQELDDVRQKIDAAEGERDELRARAGQDTEEQLTLRETELQDAFANNRETFTEAMKEELLVIAYKKMVVKIEQLKLQMNDQEHRASELEERAARATSPEAKASLQTEADLEFAAFEMSQRQLIDLTRELADELKVLMEGGQEKFAENKFNKIEEQRQLILTAMHAIRRWKEVPPNTPDSQLDEKQLAHRKFNESWRRAAIDWLTEPLNSFDFVVQAMSLNDIPGYGELHRILVTGPDGVMRGHAKRTDGIKQQLDEINLRISEIFGKEWTLDKLIEDSDKEKFMVGALHMHDTATHTAGTLKELMMTKGQMLYAWLCYRQPDARKKMEAVGWTELSMAQIEQLVGPKYIQFAEWVTEDYLPKTREERYNPVHVATFGTSIARGEHYFPLSIFKRDIESKAGLDVNRVADTTGNTPGNIIERTANSHRINTEENAFGMLLKYVTNMETWATLTPVCNNINVLLKSKAFMNALEDNHKGLSLVFENAAKVATLSYVAPQQSKFNNFIAKLQRLWAGSKISWRVFTAFKQLFSYGVFRGYATDLKFQAELFKMEPLILHNAIRNYKWAMENLAGFRDRVDKGSAGLEILEREGFDIEGKLKKFTNWGMIPNQTIDAITVACGARCVYNYEYRMAKQSGKSDEEAKQHAQTMAEVAFNRSQQSSNPAFLSPKQRSKNVVDVASTAFQNSNIGFTRAALIGMMMMRRSEKGSPAYKAGMNMFFFNTLVAQVGWTLGGAMFDWGTKLMVNAITMMFGDDDDKYIPVFSKPLIWNMIVSGLIAPVRGTTIGNWLDCLMNGNEYDLLTGLSEMMGFVNDISSTVNKAMDEEAEDEEGDLLTPAGRASLIAYELGRRLGKVSMNAIGINIETYTNMVLGAWDAIDRCIDKGVVDGLTDWQTLIDFMLIINAPRSSRKEVVKATGHDEDDAEEFAKNMGVALGIYDQEETVRGSKFFPTTRPLTDKREDMIYDLYDEAQEMGEDEE